MKKSTRLTLVIVTILFVLGMIFYPFIRRYFSAEKGNETQVLMRGVPGQGRGDKDLNINAQILKHKNLNDVFRSIGSLIPDEEVDLSFETSGKITNIYFKEGSLVKKGDLLAKVNDSPLQAELKKLQAQIPLAEDRVYRQKALLEKDAVSKETYEQVTTELEKLNADIELMKARIDQTELRAPFEGEIGLRQVSEGTYASPSTIIAKLTKIIPLKIEFSINEKNASEIVPGTSLSFKVENDLNTHQASVYAVESKVDMKTRTLKARAIYPNSNGRLQPGRSAIIEINLNEIKNALTVPSEAIIAEMGRDIAYVYKSGKAQQVELKKGLRTASEVQILQGVSPGDTLIVTGVMQIRDGMPVKIDHFID
ncbi:MAG: efflux RND transporter periplasmic adaptor subunit [Dysgonamonadaceae bacterium]|jgi:membrane fusion protein (multidrug efflux system)|nr:efflux RND transporter periplasmic adaptor subunit [Dysgonamonadaceae bacterium]